MQTFISDVQRYISELSVDQWSLALDAATTVLAALAFWYSWRQLILTTSPRVYIEGVRATGLVNQGWPVFFITLVNDGNGPATDVEIDLRIEGETNAENIAGHKWSRPQRVTVPANSHRDYFVAWTQAIHDQDVDRFESGKLLVKGYFTHLKTRQEFMYRYYPWPKVRGERPDGMPQFVPADFDPGLTVLVKGTARIKFSADGRSAAT